MKSENKGKKGFEDNSGAICQCTSCWYPRKEDGNLFFRGLQ